MERNDVIEILDAGNEAHTFMDPEFFCCTITFPIFRHG